MLTNFLKFFQFLTVEAEFSQILHDDKCIQIFGFFQTKVFIQMFFLYGWKAFLKLGINQFSSIFSVPNNGSSFSGSGNGVFFKSSITTTVYRLWVNFKPFVFIQMFFFCCWKESLKLGVKQFSSILSGPNSGSRVFIKYFITTGVYRFCVNLKPCTFLQMFFFCCWNL